MEEIIVEVQARPLSQEERIIANRRQAHAYYLQNREEILEQRRIKYLKKNRSDILKYLQPIRLANHLKRESNKIIKKHFQNDTLCLNVYGNRYSPEEFKSLFTFKEDAIFIPHDFEINNDRLTIFLDETVQHTENIMI